MLIAVIGGKVQGIEACYLAKKAGWQARLIDKRSLVPAQGLCDSFFQLDVQHDKDLPRVLDGADLILPAFEDEPALERISRWAEKAGIPCAFDIDAYRVSSSKSASNRLFQKLNLPMPKLWPECDFPVILKPDGDSGSRGVQICRSMTELNNKYAVSGAENRMTVQEYAKGASFSLEVIGFPGAYQPLQVTDLYMDGSFDCKRVIAPTKLSPERREELEGMSVSLAHALGLKGLMDVEVVENEGCLKILEIDARLPSQTPMTVFWSTGLNMVEMLGELFTNSGGRTYSPELETGNALGIIMEHIAVNEQRLEIAGEHIMGAQKHLQLHEDFFGADEAITNYTPGRKEWAATLIIKGVDREDAWERRNTVIREIMHEHDLTQYSDPEPVL
jgi:pyrrolysine biosynthesis protein PylC